jgi:DNA-binding transcriptional MerR regulator
MIKRGTIKEVAPLIGVSVHTMYQWRVVTLLQFDEDRKVSVAHALKVKEFMKKWRRHNRQKGKMPAITRGGFKDYPESVLEKIRKDLQP